MRSRPLTCVIGAGPSGLVAGKTLLEYGLPVHLYEAGDRVGGQWVLGNSSGTSSAYRSLTTNTHKGMSRYADFELPAEYPDFPSADQMAEWFGSYADHFGVREHIRFANRVVRVERLSDGRWQVETGAGEGGRYDALIVAVGNLWQPNHPDLAGEFAGTLLHARDYMDPSDPVNCVGRNVVVMGLGNSACEIAVELSVPGVARQVFLSCRSGQAIVPKRIDGRLIPAPHPSDPLGPPFASLPRPLRDWLFRTLFPRVAKRMFGGLKDPREVGLPPPPEDFFAKRFVLNDHILDRARSGQVRVKPGVRRLLGEKVEFEDGSVEEVDVLLTATGYRLVLPFFREGLLDPTGDALELFRGVMHPGFHNLFVIGVMKAICSIWPRSEQQMRWVAPVIAGEYRLPSPREIARETYPVLQVPFGNCQFYTADLQQDLARGRRRARSRAGGPDPLAR